jgi:hypothetical protein
MEGEDTMSAAETLQATVAAGVSVEVDGDDLVLEASAPPPAAVLERLSRDKAGIVALLRAANDWRAVFEEKVAFGEQHGGLPRVEAEVRAVDCCIIEWLNRHPTRSSPNCCCWCGGMEREDNVLLPFGVESAGHAWLHSACWRPWYEHRKAEAAAVLRLIGIAAPTEFPDDFAKNGGT